MESTRPSREEALIRICSYSMNAFDGKRFAFDLARYGGLWDEVWMNWDEEVPDRLTITCQDWDSASRLLEITSYWPCDGIEAKEGPDASWALGGWWD
jgi:hypothetical protein